MVGALRLSFAYIILSIENQETLAQWCKKLSNSQVSGDKKWQSRFQTYLANKEAGDQILKIITDNNLSHKDVEALFLDIRKLIDDLPVIPNSEELKIEVI